MAKTVRLVYEGCCRISIHPHRGLLGLVMILHASLATAAGTLAMAGPEG
jgi:hypothetical protein